MLRLKALHVQDFGPFKGHQTIELSPEDGVTVVYGANMRGKTSLLNAIRFAFFGKVVGRGTKPVALHSVSNLEQVQQGKYGFEVQIEFEYENHHYKLTRQCKPRTCVVTPASDNDYLVDYYLEKDGAVMGPEQAKAGLLRILPEQISRFFLFDGELLQEYEDLLSNASDMGRRISESIERILGVPVLTSTRTTLLSLKDQSEHREATAAQGDQKTRVFGNQLSDLHSKRAALNHDLHRLEGDLDTMRAQKAALEDAMKKKERIAALLDRRDRLEVQLKEIDARRLAKQGELQQAMAGAWTTLLADLIKANIQTLRASESHLQTEMLRAEVLRSLHTDAEAECPACLQQVTSEAKRRIESSVHATNEVERVAKERELVGVRRKLEALDQYAGAGRGELLRVRWDDVEEAKIDYAAKKADRDEIRKQLEEVDEDSLRKTKADFESTIRQIHVLEKGVQATREHIEHNKVDAEKIQQRLDKLAGANLGVERKRRELFTDLHQLFDEGVQVYREQLRKRVEEDATAHFKAMTTEPDYAGLRINDSYGLTIVHKDKTDIPVRSAGAEHVVALSLVGALQNNAPLRGPIIIDSPFGRLDSEHTQNVVRALPAMSQQVVLLVYDNELPPDLVRKELKFQLRGEWELKRCSARHTELVPRKD